MSKCFACGNKEAQKVKISEKEVRWLCEYHLKIYKNQGRVAQPHFFKASELLEK